MTNPSRENPIATSVSRRMLIFSGAIGLVATGATNLLTGLQLREELNKIWARRSLNGNWSIDPYNIDRKDPNRYYRGSAERQLFSSFVPDRAKSIASTDHPGDWVPNTNIISVGGPNSQALTKISSLEAIASSKPLTYVTDGPLEDIIENYGDGPIIEKNYWIRFATNEKVRCVPRTTPTKVVIAGKPTEIAALTDCYGIISIFPNPVNHKLKHLVFDGTHGVAISGLADILSDPTSRERVHKFASEHNYGQMLYRVPCQVQPDGSYTVAASPTLERTLPWAARDTPQYSMDEFLAQLDNVLNKAA